MGTAYQEKGGEHGWRMLVKEHKNGLNVSGEHMPLKREMIGENILEAFYASGNGMMIKRAEFPTLFDPAYFAYAEDVYLSWLAHLKGRRVAINLKAGMQHLGAGTSKANPGFNSFVKW